MEIQIHYLCFRLIFNKNNIQVFSKENYEKSKHSLYIRTEIIQHASFVCMEHAIRKLLDVLYLKTFRLLEDIRGSDSTQ